MFSPLRFFAYNSESEKDKNLVTFLKIHRNLLKDKSLSMDFLRLPWQHFLGRALREDQVLQNSNDVTVTSLLDQSEQNFELFLKMIISTSVQNFSRIKFLTLPWRHIL